MAAGGSEKTRQLLEESVLAISRLPAGEPEGGTSAFSQFKTGVTRARSGGADTRGLLDPLEPKAAVLGFLVDLHVKKSMFRKQVSGVFETLVQLDSWRLAVRLNEPLLSRLPAELSELLEAVPIPPPVSEPPAPAPAPTARPVPAPTAASQAEPSGSGSAGAAELEPGQADGPGSVEEAGSDVGLPPPTDSAVRMAISLARDRVEAGGGADARAPQPACASATCVAGSAAMKGSHSFNMRLFAEATQQMEDLGYSAAHVDTALEAFEKLYTAISKMTRSDSTADDEVLKRFEPKGQLLQFLDDFEGRKRNHRGRVDLVRRKLMAFEGWSAAAAPRATEEEGPRQRSAHSPPPLPPPHLPRSLPSSSPVQRCSELSCTVA